MNRVIERGAGVSPTAADRVRTRAADLVRHSADRSLRMVRRMLFPMARPPRSPRRIVVHLVGNVGDIVVATPMLQEMRRRAPNAHIRLLTSAGRGGNPGATDLLDDAGIVDEIEQYDVDAMKRPRALRSSVSELRARRPDLIVLCPTSLNSWTQNVRNLLFARLVGPSYVTAPRVPTIRWSLGAQVRVHEFFPHESQRYLAMLDELGSLSADPAVPDPDGEDAGGVARIAADVAGSSLERVDAHTPDRPFVAICPGGKQVEHRWPADRFRTVIAHLAEDDDLAFVAVGNRAERALCARVLEPAGRRAVNAAGALTLRETAALLGRSRLLLTNDTGPMHLAASLDVPIVAVFGGAMPPGRWYPWASRATVFRVEAACPVCLGRSDRPHCVERIPADAVTHACRAALRPTATSRSAATVDAMCLLPDPRGTTATRRIGARRSRGDVDWHEIFDPDTSDPDTGDHDISDQRIGTTS